MLLDHDEVTTRLDSPQNLFNKLRKYNAGDSIASLSSTANVDDFISRIHNPTQELAPSLDELIPDAEDKLNEKLIKDKAEDVLIATLDELRMRLAEVEKPEKLSKIAADMGKILNLGNKPESHNRNSSVIVYKPSVVHENHYEQIAANE